MQDYWLGFLTCAVLISVYRLLSYLARERTIVERRRGNDVRVLRLPIRKTVAGS
jgi:hypothetical protein